MRVEKSWGYEEIIHNGDYCCKLLVYTKPIASSLHYHEHKHETFVVLSGQFVLETDTGIEDLMPGDHVVLYPLNRHRVRCMLPGTIVEASTHDYPADCIRLIPSET
jgi:mannose-6-phosphate isomerase-like protein (cupin superfamily)